MKTWNKKKKTKHHSKVKYKVLPRGKKIVSVISKVRYCRCKKYKDCDFVPKQFLLIVLTTNIKSRKHKKVSKQTY
jgi:hypothetical protein